MKREISEHTFFDDRFVEPITLIDLGACRGEFTKSILASYPVERAILVEANPTNFRALNFNEPVKLYNRAISHEKNRTIKFLEDPNSPYNGSLNFNYFSGIEHSISTITLREIIEENALSRIHLLKVDVEGAEYDVLENVEDDVLSKIDQITVEFHDFVEPSFKPRNEIVIQKLVDRGFMYLSCKSTSYRYGSQDYDVVFRRL